MLRSRFHVLPLLPFLTFLMQPAAPSAAQNGHFSLSGSAVHVYNLVGKVEVVPGSGASVLVDLTQQGKDGARLGTKTFSENGTFFVITYPSDHIRAPQVGWGSTSMEVANDGTFGDRPKRSHFFGHKVRIDNKGSGLEAWCDLRISVPKGQKITVHLGVGQINATNIDGDIVLDTGSGSVSVRGGNGPLVVDTGSGDVAVTGHAGDALLDTGSGTIKATDLSGDRLSFDTGSGSVIARAIKGRKLSVDTGSGSVELTGITAPSVHVDTGSGDVELALSGDVDQLDVDTGSGSVTIEAPSSLGASLHIETGSGDIDSDFPLKITKRESDTLLASVGDGRGHIVIDTGSGNVRLLRAAAN